MPTVTPQVMILNGQEVITGNGSIVPAPARGTAAELLDRLAARLGPNGEILITGAAPDWLDLIYPDAASGWHVSGRDRWYTVSKHAGGGLLRVGYLPAIPPVQDPLMVPGNYVETALLHQAFADMTGVPFFGGGGGTFPLLLDAHMSVKGQPPLRRWIDPDAPVVAEQPNPGGRDWTAPGFTGTPAVTIDRNAMYLGMLNGTYLPLDALADTGTLPWEPGRAGYWQFTCPDNPEPRLPHPCGVRAVPGEPIWCAHPTLDLLIRTLGMDLDITGSWTAPKTRSVRCCDGVYKVMRDARAEWAGAADASSVVLLKALKQVWAQGIATFARPNRRWTRPDWRNIWFGDGRTSMWRALYNAGQAAGIWPCELHADAAAFTDPNAPSAFRIGSGMGEWKIQETRRAE